MQLEERAMSSAQGVEMPEVSSFPVNEAIFGAAAEIHEPGAEGDQRQVCAPPLAAGMAMQIPLVLSKIAKFLPPSDVTRLRSTCTGWNQEFCPVMRKQGPEIDLRYYDKGITFRKFLEMLKTSKSIPFGIYSLDMNMLESEDPDTEPQLCTEFFSLLGNSIVRLYLTCYSYPGHHMTEDGGRQRMNLKKMEIIRRAIFELTPNLEELHLYLNVSELQDTTGGDRNPHPSTSPRTPLRNLKILELFGAATQENPPSCQELVIDIVHAAAGAGLEELILLHRGSNKGVLSTLLDHGIGGSLKMLRMHGLQTDDFHDLIKLSQRSEHLLKLREFQFALGASEDQAICYELLYKFLSIQAPTLEALLVYARPHGIRIPCLVNLKEIMLPCNDNMDSVTTIFKLDSPSLQLNFPNLVTLHHGGQLLTAQSVAQMAAIRHSGVTTLKFGSAALDSNEILPKLEELFPSVINLRIFLNRLDLIPQLWTAWPNLEVLELHLGFNCFAEAQGPKCLDQLITGVPGSETEAKGGMWVEASRAKLAKLKSALGITDLKQLQEFSFNASCVGPKRVYISDISHHFGFKAPGSKIRVLNLKGLEDGSSGE